jgi:hypothetical protein
VDRSPQDVRRAGPPTSSAGATTEPLWSLLAAHLAENRLPARDFLDDEAYQREVAGRFYRRDAHARTVFDTAEGLRHYLGAVAARQCEHKRVRVPVEAI